MGTGTSEPKEWSNKLRFVSASQQPPLVASVTEDEAESSCVAMEYDVNKFLHLYENMMRAQEEDHSATIAHLQPMLELLEASGPECGTLTGKKISMTREIQYSTLRRALATIEQRYDFVKKDLQWIMVMNTLANQNVRDDSFISWAEIVQCYKACILGMQTLQYIPSPGETRKRTRDRSMSIVLTFQPPAADIQKTSSSSQFHRKPNRKSNLVTSFTAVFFLGTSLVFFVDRS
eukprot:CAMPEP_0117065054 /NCGR_PEP_ID=MMETSP0472-20121206/45465_1 /TAXON_ID=693140 ORGANISM="Tiarina fusus, Strain LIS" /NCGR_SAMPLE_ID=MMETSP0472 /ASSEMBLY_ACC=CAM_ASM_000603 /LENGTH=232 /DNA_ID=CAMNT_0004785501 /DNA_START=22 /DNA_END=717 /DNA_ORIENTATION=+